MSGSIPPTPGRWTFGPSKFRVLTSNGRVCGEASGRVAGARVVGLGRRKKRARAVVLFAGRAGVCECCAGSSLRAASPSAPVCPAGSEPPGGRWGQAGADRCDMDMAGIEQCRRQ